MSFWTTIEGLFTGDTYYPGNPERVNRLKELNNDCQIYINDCKNLAQELHDEMQEINRVIAQYYPDGKIPDNIKLQKDIVDQIPFEDLIDVFTPLLEIPAISGALLFANVILEAKDGSALAAGLEASLGITVMWASEGLFFAPVAGLAVGAIQGSLKRDELRRLIPKAVETRKKVYLDYSYNKYLSEQLKNIKTSLDALTGVGFNEANVLDVLSRQVGLIQKEAESKTNDFLKTLKTIDTARNSWTKED